ncbi:cardiolipin synthase ClsB [Chitinibacter tainanensis]|uniref:cardiolipin synthase ClsB n=1 Tax=Chitinibacter tainanensis TaxID=230667 RepID=UPI0004007F2E|nr:cardiolipin synthase ClsB [Chitinibacter tainanensis]
MKRPPLRENNQVKLLRNGGEFFPLLLRQIAAAEREVLLESYIFASDEIGRSVLEALCAAAQRGVLVRVLLDGFGARDLPAHWRAELKTAGVQLLFFRPEVKRFALNRARLRRMHRKLSCFDGRIALVGGINIISDFDEPHLAPRYDYAVQLIGPVVNDVRAALQHEWQHSAWAQLKRKWANRLTLDTPVEYVGATPIQFVTRDNTRNRNAIEQAYLHRIEAARQEIVIANAYFLPGRRIRQALLQAARREVAVILLLQDERDHALLQYASWAFYRPLVAAGVEIYHYKAGFMHAKVAVIDGEWATVGSSNIDPFSLMLAREANVFIHDAHFAQTLRHDIQRHLVRDAQAILPQHIQRAGFGLRTLVWGAFALVRLLLGVTGYGGRKYLE